MTAPRTAPRTPTPHLGPGTANKAGRAMGGRASLRVDVSSTNGVGALASVATSLRDPVSYRLGRRLELPSQLSRCTSGPNQLDHLLSECRRVRRSRLRHRGLLLLAKRIGVHGTGATPGSIPARRTPHAAGDQGRHKQMIDPVAEPGQAAHASSPPFDATNVDAVLIRHHSMTWQCRRCGRTVDLVLRDGDRCAACAMRTRAGRTLPADDGAADPPG